MYLVYLPDVGRPPKPLIQKHVGRVSSRLPNDQDRIVRAARTPGGTSARRPRRRPAVRAESLPCSGRGVRDRLGTLSRGLSYAARRR